MGRVGGRACAALGAGGNEKTVGPACGEVGAGRGQSPGMGVGRVLLLEVEGTEGSYGGGDPFR